MHSHHVRTSVAVDPRSDVGGRAVGTINHYADPGQRVRAGLQQVIPITPGGLGGISHPADQRSGGTGNTATVQPGGDLIFHRVGKFTTTSGEELDAVVGHRVVRGGDHHAEVGGELAHEVGDSGGGQDPDPQHIGTRRREARSNGGLQHLSAGPRVPPHNGDRPVAQTAVGEHPGGCTR
jgi:hypothetical protein